MNRVFLITLSFVSLEIVGIRATEEEIIFEKHVPNHHTSSSNKSSFVKHRLDNHKSFILATTEKYGTKDPYELEEISVQTLSKGETSEAANALISAAVYGHNDIQASLADIDHKSLEYFDSNKPQSAEAIDYYTNTLLPKVKEHFVSQLKNSAHNIKVNLPVGSHKTEKSLTFNSIK